MAAKGKAGVSPRPRKRNAGENPPADAKFPADAAAHKTAAAAIDAELDEALDQTFPASDPVAIESTLVSGRRR